uniref:Ribosomal RNA-processing protein 40 n=1 Tax=Arcella intermedia TaxID=1963864 RepID=A0A6B2LGZ2_9EUKA
MMALNQKLNCVVTPGEAIGEVTEGTVKLANGLMQNQSTIYATKAGILRIKSPDIYFVENSQRRYVPSLDDMVIGIVIDKRVDSFLVDVGCHQPASLPYNNFEGATKKNRPLYEVGDLVYARVCVTSRDMEPELSCLTLQGKADTFGKLNGGYMFKCSTGLVRDCLSRNSIILNALGKKIPFEVAIGMNGRIWTNAADSKTTILIANAIQNSEHLNEKQILSMVHKMTNLQAHQT